MSRSLKMIFRVILLVWMTLPSSAPGEEILLTTAFVPGTECYSSNCKTGQGALQCLTTGSLGSYVSASRFFQQNKNGSTIQRTVNIPVKVENVTIGDTGESDTYAKVSTVQKVIVLVNPLAYKAFLQTARQNPNCLNTFCQHNCVKVTTLESSSIKTVINLFKNARVPLTIQGQTYSVYRLKQMNPSEQRALAINLLLDSRNSMTSALCLGETMNSIMLRMMCSQCIQTMGHGSTGEVNKTCTTFDPSTNVAYDEQPNDTNASYQAQLATIVAQQNATMQGIVGNSNPATVVDLNQVITNLNNSFNSKVNSATSRFNSAVDTYNTGVSTYNTANYTYNNAGTIASNNAQNARIAAYNAAQKTASHEVQNAQTNASNTAQKEVSSSLS